MEKGTPVTQEFILKLILWAFILAAAVGAGYAIYQNEAASQRRIDEEMERARRPM